MTASSSNTKLLRPTETRRGRLDGTFTRIKRVPVSESCTATPTLSASTGAEGNGPPLTAATGVSSGAISFRNLRASAPSSRGRQSATSRRWIFSAASAGRSSSTQSDAWSELSSSTKSRQSASVSAGVRPSGVDTVVPDRTCARSRAIRTAKNSSRLEDAIAQSFRRSSSGRSGSAASASTRRSNSSHDSSRFRNRSGRGASRRTAATAAPTIRSAFADRAIAPPSLRPRLSGRQ